MLKMVDGTGIIGVDMVCPLGGTVSPPQPPNYDKVEVEGVGSLMLPNSLEAPVERVELIGNSVQPTTTGKNLFDESKAVTGRINPDNGELLPETSYISSDYIEVQEGETYFQSGSGDGYYRAFYDMNKKFTSIPTKGIFKITVPVGSKFLRISGRKERFGDWMIEKGDKATPYEPYTGLKSSPSPEYPQEIKNVGKWNEEKQKYEINVKVTGKNLFNHEKAKNVNNWEECHSMPTYKDFPVYVGKGNNFSFSFTENLIAMKSEIVAGVVLVKSSGINKWIYDGGNNFNATCTGIAKEDYIYIRSNKERIHFFVNDIKTLQVEINPVPTEYEPYTEQTLTLTYDRPITKWDKLVEQGGQYGWLYQSAVDTDVKPSRLDLFPNGFSLFKDFGNGVYVYKVTNIKKAIGFQTSLCEQFKNKDGSYSTGDLFCYSDQPSIQMQYFVTDIPTLEEFKTWMETNPLTMVYKTTESHFIPLPESVQQQLQALHSENGTTHVFVDSGEVPCGIKLTYRKEI